MSVLLDALEAKYGKVLAAVLLLLGTGCIIAGTAIAWQVRAWDVHGWCDWWCGWCDWWFG